MVVISKRMVRGTGLISLCLALVCGSVQQLQASETFRDCDVCPEMVVVPAGSFEMRVAPWGPGHPHDEGYFYTVTFAQPFAVGKFEVTFDQWDACVADGKCPIVDDAQSGRGSQPVVNVSWIQARAYLRWLSAKTRKRYRLPSNSEWEYAARAGLDMNRYFGIPEAEVCLYGNVYDRSAQREYEFDWPPLPCDDGHVGAAPVGSFRANSFGLYDMIGNVHEWTEDCASPDWRGAPSTGEPWLKGDCSLRGYRGASWLTNEPYYLIESNRFRYSGAGDADLGFRVIRDLP